LLKGAIENWKSLNPLLRSKVKKLKLDEDSEPVDYFVQDDETNLSNVKFLTSKSNNSSSLSTQKHNEIMKLLVEKDINYAYDYSQCPLWKLKFYKLENNLYDVLLTVNHAISEDRCNIQLIMKLLEIIEKMHRNEYVKEKEYPLLPAMYGTYVHKPPPGEIDFESYSAKRPSFIQLEVAKQESFDRHSTNLTEHDINHIQVVDVQTNEIYSSIPSLLEISKNNYSKFKTISFDARKLVSKCKEKKCKVTSCLNLISVLALKDLYLKYGNEEEKQRSISYGNVISVRNFTDNDAVKIKDNMGIYIMNIMNKYRAQQQGSRFTSEDIFWSLVQSDSEFMMHKIQSGKIFQTPRFEEENFTNKGYSGF
jgi:hypothetical protein